MEIVTNFSYASNSYLSLYKGGNTGQGNAMGRLVANARKTIGLTGTLMNGYASSLFYLLYRLNSNLMKKRLAFDYNQVKDFVSTYGAHEEIVEATEVNTEGVVTRMGRRMSLKEKPKISPHMLSILLDMTIFLKLEEIKMPDNLQLPPYEEIIDLVKMEDELKVPYMEYLTNITSKIRTDKRLLGNLATDAIAIPDMPFIPRNAQEVCFYEPTTTREDFGLTNKEKRLIENVGKELDQDRDCLVYITFSNQQVATDLQNILKDAFPNKTIKFLPSSVPAAKRKEWINKNPSDVLICNPELVKTGLTLLSFVTIIFYETTYNVFTLKQASRRSWRIGQTEDIKVIFMAYENTPQHKALELIGAKISAANSLEGKFSGDDDLSSMGEEDDNIQLALAKSILNGDTSSKEIKMTSIQNFGGDRDFNNFELYYQSLLDEDNKLEQLEKEQRAIQAELIETATKNEEKEISIHDGHGGNWGSGLAEMFGISNNPNIEICSMPKTETKKPLVDISKIKAFDEVKYKGEWNTVELSNDYNLIICNEHTKYKILFIEDIKQEIELHKETADAIEYQQSKVVSTPKSTNSDMTNLFETPNDQIHTIPNTEPKVIKKSDDSNLSYVAIIGKGKKAKRVKINQANNLFDVLAEANGTTGGVQLAFDF